MSVTSFVTGATGLVGGALVDALLARGDTVVALVRDGRDAEALVARGVQVEFGDLGEERGVWRARAHDADVVWHAALPRHPFPMRGVHVRRLRGRAADAAGVLARSLPAGATVVMASSHLVYGTSAAGTVGDGAPEQPVGMGHAALAAEGALRDTALRAVRLGWVYGPSGLAPGLVRGIRERRLRIVGGGANLMPLVSANDAAAALLVAADAPPGVYAAAEPDPPTQRQLVEHLTRQMGARMTDVLPPAMAALSLGGGMVAEMTASCPLAGTALAGHGWTPRDDWRRDLLARVDATPPA